MIINSFITFSVFILTYFIYKRFKKNSEISSSSSSFPQKRKMSFSSLTMIRGSFPLSSHVHSPIINILCSFSCLPTEEKCKEITMKLFEMFRFKSTPIFNQITKQWEFLEVNPNINDHIITTNLNNEEECYNYIEYLSKTSFDHLKGKPYWIFHRIVNKGNGMSFLLMRVHHVIGDGIALVLAIDRIFTDSKGNPVKTALPSSKYDPKVVKELKEVNKQKTSFLSQIPTIISSFLRVISVATSNYDSDLLFTSQNKKKLVMNIKNQKILYLPTISLDYVKDLKNKANCTVNDILLGAMTGAIRRYCEKLNDPLIKSGESLQMRALLPVSFPRPDHEVNDMNRCLRNKWAFVSAPMPINEKTSKERVQSCLKTMNFIKTSPDAYVQLWLMNNILAYAPPFVVCETAQDSFSRHSIVFSNVPGPQNAIYYGSQEILGIQAIFPNILPQTIIMSYNGGIYGNLVVDTTIVKDHELLKETYLEELKELGKIYDVDTTKILKASS